VLRIPLVYNVVLATVCELLTVQLVPLPDTIYVPAITVDPATYCPRIMPVEDDVVSVVPEIEPVKVLDWAPFVIATGVPTDPTV